MPDDKHGIPRPTTYCRVCAKQLLAGEEGGARAFALCWRCAKQFWPDQLAEIQEKCLHADVKPAGFEHDQGVYHRATLRCQDCGVEDIGEWEICTCEKKEEVKP